MNIFLNHISKLVIFFFPIHYFRFYLRAKKNFLKIKISNKVEQYRSLWEKIINFEIKEELSNDFFFGTEIDNKIKIRQYVFQKILKQNFLNHLIFSKYLKLIFPLPSSIIKVLEKNGIPTNSLFSKILWFFLVVCFYFCSFFYIFYVILNFFKYSFLFNKNNCNYTFVVSANNFDGTSEKFKNWLKVTYNLENYKLLSKKNDIIFLNLNKFN